MKHTLMILFASAAVACGQDYCWTNFAGSLEADGDVNGTGDAARFGQLYGIDINGAEDALFVCDRGAGKIKKITLPGAVVTTVVSGFDLVQLVVNKVNGNIYFPDITQNTIFRLVPPYTNAPPTAIATGIHAYGGGVDSATDTLYVSGQDFDNGHAIFYIANAGGATPGALTRIAGLEATPGFEDGTLDDARFRNPMGIAVVVSGGNTNLYVNDRANHAIRLIDLGAGMVTTVAGTGSPGCTDGTSTNAQFTQPHNVVMGPDGNLYVCDQDNYTVRKITLPDGEVTTIGGLCGTAGAAEGCGAEALNGNLGQITIDSAGNIYAADRGNAVAGVDYARVSKGTPPPAPPTLQITSIQFVSGNVQIDFTAEPGDTANLFTLQSSGAVNGTFNGVSATITQEGPAGSFRAVVAPSGNIQFYRVQR